MRYFTVLSSQHFPMKDTYIFLILVFIKITFKIGFWLITTGAGTLLGITYSNTSSEEEPFTSSFMFKHMHFCFNKYFAYGNLCKAAKHKYIFPCYTSIQMNFFLQALKYIMLLSKIQNTSF